MLTASAEANMNPTTDSGPAPAGDLVPSPNPPLTKPLSIRVMGIGGAGGNAISHMAKTDLCSYPLVALHTSARILDITQAPEKVLLGAELTHGLGAGGDPSLGRAAAERDVPLLKRLCQGVDLLFIVTGLGGGTGTGVAPVLARVAKESGALVLGIATMPFEIEGVRRRHHAEQGLQEFKAAADGVICLANQKIYRLVDEKTSVLESLKITNDLLAQGIRGICQMVTRPGLIHVDFADLCSVLRGSHEEGCFACVEAEGEGRAREIIERLLACPFLDGGQALSEAESILVSLTGGPDLSMADIKRIMDEINRRTDQARVVMGASVAEDSKGRIGLTLITARRNTPFGVNPTPAQRPGEAASLTVPFPAPELDERLPRTASSSGRHCGINFPRPESSPSSLRENQGRPVEVPPPATRPTIRLQQGSLPLEIVSKGRFEKSHPTIHRGEDLDLPTYVRRGIPLN